MHFISVLKVLGSLLMMFSLSMLPPIFVASIYHDGAIMPFVFSFAITFGSGLLLWLFCFSSKRELKTRDGFLVVVLFWVVLSFFGAIPFMLDPVHQLTLVDAWFESVSGLTTTGATVLSSLDQLPHAILYYRQQLHLLGGMGIIVLAVAILPMLGVGAAQLVRAETVGPIKDTRLRPRVAETSKALWSIYVGLVVLCASSYWLAGMPFFDALCESYSTVSTGGFSIHDASFAFYQNDMVSAVAILFMIFGATNFGLHFNFFQSGKISVYLSDPEFRSYFYFLLSVSAIVSCSLLFLYHYPGGNTKVMLDSLFAVVSLSSTTGLTSQNFAIWPTFIPYLLMFVAIVGGCSASTSGGVKVIRCLMLRSQGARELHRIVHPNAVMAVKVGGQVLPEEVVQVIWSFIAVFTFTTISRRHGRRSGPSTFFCNPRWCITSHVTLPVMLLS